MSVYSRKWLFIILIALSVLPFQNCGQGFKTSEELSTLCTAKIRDQAKLSKVAGLKCDLAADYSCERRVFSPAMESEASSGEECFGDFCVHVDTRIFNTSSAHSSADLAEFLPGGEYNRIEVNCAHKHREKEVALFVGYADSIEVALDAARTACEGSH